MDIGDLVISIAVMVDGLAIAAFFFRRRRLNLALGSGISLVAGGLVLILRIYDLISLLTFSVLAGTVVTVALASFYAMTNRSREARVLLILFIAAVGALPLFQIYVLHFPMYVLYALWLGVVVVIVYFERFHRHVPGTTGTK